MSITLDEAKPFEHSLLNLDAAMYRAGFKLVSVVVKRIEPRRNKADFMYKGVSGEILLCQEES